MSNLNEKELLKIQVHNLKLALRRKQEQITRLKDEHESQLAKIKKEYSIKLLHLRITTSNKKPKSENIVPFLCDILNSITGISGKDILSNSRKRDVVVARYIIIHTLRMQGKTLVFIGRLINNQHHSSIIHAINSVENWLTYPDYYKKEVEIYNKTKKMLEDLKN